MVAYALGGPVVAVHESGVGSPGFRLWTELLTGLECGGNGRLGSLAGGDGIVYCGCHFWSNDFHQRCELADILDTVSRKAKALLLDQHEKLEYLC